MSKFVLPTAVTAVAAAVCLAFVLPAQAKEGKDAGGAKPFHGAIESLDATGKTVTVKGKSETKTFKLGDDCKFGSKDSPATQLSDFKVGDKVSVVFTEEGGTATAHRIAAHSGSKKGKSGGGEAPAAPAPGAKE